MASAPHDASNQYVYRRVPPKQWNQKTGEATADAFEPNQGLSVFNAGFASPRSTLQAYIDEQSARLDSPDTPERKKEAIRRRLENGDLSSVEELYRQNWRVAKLLVSAFTQRGFWLDAPDPYGPQRGHQNVRYKESSAELEAFQQYGDVWAAEATILDEVASLTNN